MRTPALVVGAVNGAARSRVLATGRFAARAGPVTAARVATGVRPAATSATTASSAASLQRARPTTGAPIAGSAPFAATASSAVPSATTAAGSTCWRRWPSVAGHLDAELPAVQHAPIHGVERVLGVTFVVEPHEGEAAALAGVPVPGNVDVAHLAAALEHPPQVVRRRAVRQVVDLWKI